MSGPRVSVVVPVWNGRRWLEGCLGSLAAQTRPPDQIVVVDNGSQDGSAQVARELAPAATVIALETNGGFARAANLGIEAAEGEVVVLLNTDVVLVADWVQRMCGSLLADPATGSVACKMLQLDRPGVLYDAGDILRRDGACEQRGRFTADDGRFDAPGEVFGACAGAAAYRRSALRAVGGFDERYFAYLEDVDLALRLRLAGWGCRYEPVVAWHAGEGSSHQLPGGHRRLVERNTLLLVATTFPPRWLPLVAYRQLSWLVHALREGTAADFARGLAAGLAMLPTALRSRRGRRTASRVDIAEVVPAQPIRGPRAEGHRSRHAAVNPADTGRGPGAR